MKLTKALKLIKKYCKEERCSVGVCPLACVPKDDDEESIVDCMLDIRLMEDWNAKEINRCVKLMGIGERAL